MSADRINGLADDIHAAITELADGAVYPDLTDAINALRDAALAALAALAAQPAQAVQADGEDAARWRLLAKHWNSAQMRWQKAPNVPKSITLTIDFTQQARGASEIEAFFADAARALAGKEGERG